MQREQKDRQPKLLSYIIAEILKVVVYFESATKTSFPGRLGGGTILIVVLRYDLPFAMC